MVVMLVVVAFTTTKPDDKRALVVHSSTRMHTMRMVAWACKLPSILLRIFIYLVNINAQRESEGEEKLMTVLLKG